MGCVLYLVVFAGIVILYIVALMWWTVSSIAQVLTALAATAPVAHRYGDRIEVFFVVPILNVAIWELLLNPLIGAESEYPFILYFGWSSALVTGAIGAAIGRALYTPDRRTGSHEGVPSSPFLTHGKAIPGNAQMAMTAHPSLIDDVGRLTRAITTNAVAVVRSTWEPFAQWSGQQLRVFNMRRRKAVAVCDVEDVRFGASDVLLTIPIIVLLGGGLLGSFATRKPAEALLLLAGVVVEVVVVGLASQVVWRRLLPYRWTVFCVTIALHGIALVLLCQTDSRIGIAGAGLSLFGPLMPLVLIAASPTGVTFVIGGFALFVSATLVRYATGHIFAPCLRGALFTSVGISCWMLCGFFGVAMCIAASG